MGQTWPASIWNLGRDGGLSWGAISPPRQHLNYRECRIFHWPVTQRGCTAGIQRLQLWPGCTRGENPRGIYHGRTGISRPRWHARELPPMPQNGHWMEGPGACSVWYGGCSTGKTTFWGHTSVYPRTSPSGTPITTYTTEWSWGASMVLPRGNTTINSGSSGSYPFYLCEKKHQEEFWFADLRRAVPKNRRRERLWNEFISVEMGRLVDTGVAARHVPHWDDQFLCKTRWWMRVIL